MLGLQRHWKTNKTNGSLPKSSKKVSLSSQSVKKVSLLFMTDFLFSQAHGTRRFKWENEFCKNFHRIQTEIFTSENI